MFCEADQSVSTVRTLLCTEQVKNCLLIHIVMKVNSIGVGSCCRCLISRPRTVATLGTSAGSDEANRRTSLALDCCHDVGLICVLIAFLGLLTGLLLATGDGLRCNEVDIGAVKSLVNCCKITGYGR